jgi:hypothetical protein
MYTFEPAGMTADSLAFVVTLKRSSSESAAKQEIRTFADISASFYEAEFQVEALGTALSEHCGSRREFFFLAVIPL